MRIVHEGRGGYIDLFAIHVPARACHAHREALRELVTAEPERWSLAGRGEG
jgi:hypothetical protein